MYWLLALTLLPTAAFANAGGPGFDVMSLLPIVLIFVVFYFLLLRPQQAKMKKHQEMLNNLHRGDKVVTAGGIIGTVSKINTDTEVMLEIDDNVRVRVVKSMISEVMTKSEPVSQSNNVTTLPNPANKATSSATKAATPAKAKLAAKAPVKTKKTPSKK